MKDYLWHEPASYRRAIYYENERNDPLPSLKFAGAVFAIMLGLRLLVGLNPQPDAHPPGWLATAGIAALTAVFAAYGLPAFMSLFPGSIVIFSDKGINNNKIIGTGWRIRFWPWEQIASCATGTEFVGGRTYDVINVISTDNETLVTLAYTDHNAPGQINEFLRAQGKRPL